MNLRSLKILVSLLALSLPAMAQHVMRSEFAPYLLRKDAEARSRTAMGSYIEFNPVAVGSSFGDVTREQHIDVPQSWLDLVTIIHLESVGSAYTLLINGQTVVECQDSLTPSEYNISPYLHVGGNIITLVSHSSALPLEAGVTAPDRARFSDSYIYTQNRLRILDYDLTMTELDNGIDGQLFIDVIVENRFNFQETIEVGFDVYDPAGKLLDFSTSKATIEGNSVDTIRFKPYLYGATKYRWDPAAATTMRSVGRASTRPLDQRLYSVMIFTKSNGSASNYIPFDVGFSMAKYADKALQVWDHPITLKTISYNALGDKKQTEAELRAIRRGGHNSVQPDYPQPIWFYRLCDKIGLYVIDQVAINANDSEDDRRVGGTPSNDPALLDEYLLRVKKAYYRTRNFTCVVAYSLGGESGNGYNMYKAYQWLKSVEQRRPVIYKWANGEWNSDSITIEK